MRARVYCSSVRSSKRRISSILRSRRSATSGATATEDCSMALTGSVLHAIGHEARMQRGDAGRGLIQRHGLGLAGAPQADVDGAVTDGALAHGHADRHPDQVGVGEAHPRAALSVVDHGGQAGCGQLVGEAIRMRGGLVADRDHPDVERGDRRRPDAAVLVERLLDRGGGDASRADAVAPHHDRLLDAVLVEVHRAHGFAEARAELEDVADLDHGLDREHAVAHRAAISVLDLVEVGELSLEVAWRLDAGEMPPGAVGTRHPRPLAQRLVGDDAADASGPDADGPDRAGPGPERRLDLFGRRGLGRLTQYLAELEFVQTT